MKMAEILDAKAVRFAAGASSKKRLLQTLSEQAETVYDMKADEVFSALQARENLGTTGVGRGVAIPHARFETLDRIVGLFYRLEKPVNYDSLDRQPVDLIFTLLAPANDSPEHLKALAMVSRTLRSEDNCSKLRANSDPQTLYSILTELTTSKAA
ncbi:PTS sugar transporter subunit IIA [Neptunicoccus cionae]|uniref:PTS sugar transporter subunit IIA n=1 Tax=Neptunicoccus cionae TaxID=2035344 RepID=UPI000C789DCE|nr:PTS sugar transporter subunit IIA [Amylibacter cionae]PLS22750.1 PTS lactose transporter subunit IIC [Amylibacter cionae]